MTSQTRLADLLVLSLLAASLAGCATTTLTNGAALAKAGQSASLQMEANTSLSAETMTSLRQAVAFNDGFNNAVGNPASATFLANMTTVQGRMRQYAKLLDDLSGCYSALGDLSSYDASGALDTSLDALSTDTQKFAGSVGHPVTIPPVALAGAKGIGGLAIGAFQARKVKDASDKIEQILQQVIVIVDDKTTRAKLVPADAEVEGQVTQAAAVLYDSRVYSYAPILNTLGSPLSLAPASDADTVVRSDPKVQRGLNNVVVEMALERSNAIGDSYDKSVAALKALVPMHEALKRGAPIDLKQLLSTTAELQSIAASLQSSAAPKSTGK